MINNKKKFIHSLTGVLAAVTCVTAGVCFIVACIMIYKSTGDDPFSRASVSNAFGYIQIPVYICLALTAIGFILNFFAPLDNEKKSNIPNPEMTLERHLQRKDQRGLSEDEASSLKKYRTALTASKICLVLILAAETVAYILLIARSGILARGGAETESVTANTIDALLWFLPFVALAFALILGCDILKRHLIKKEIAVLERLPAIKNAAKAETDSNTEGERSISLLVIRIALVACALVLLVYGFVTGGYVDVLAKAVAICTECIGLG